MIVDRARLCAGRISFHVDKKRCAFKRRTSTTPSLLTALASTGHQRSWCEPIEEDLVPEREYDLDLHKRHHRPRAPLTRTTSAPQLISTTTTVPIQINNLRSAFSSPPFPFFLIPALVKWRTSYLGATPSTLVFVAPVTSISRLPRPALLPRRCATKSAISLPPLTTQRRKRYPSLHLSAPALLISSSQAFDTEMQSFFFLFTRYLAERAKSQDLYVALSCLSVSSTHQSPVHGIASNLQPRIRSFLTPTFPRPRTPRTSTSSPYSRSMAVWVLPWVCENRRPRFSPSLTWAFRYDWCQKCA